MQIKRISAESFLFKIRRKENIFIFAATKWGDRQLSLSVIFVELIKILGD